MKGVMRFYRKKKLSWRYIGLYEILQHEGKVAYELALLAELASIYQVFNVSMLRKCLGDPTSILPLEGLGVNEDLYYEEVPVDILDRHIKRLRNREITTMNVLLRNHLVKGATWEAEDDIRSPYPDRFSS